MHKFIRLAVVLVVMALLVATAAPALAEDEGDRDNGDNGNVWFVCPTLGGANDNEVFTPPGQPTVKPKKGHPNGGPHPALGPSNGTDFDSAEPGDVFWTVPPPDDGNGNGGGGNGG